jgi:hypothetical protein
MMKRLCLLIALPLILLGLSGVASSAGASGVFTCKGMHSGTISGNVNVPKGDLCSLDGATVSAGSVTVQKGGGLVIIHGSTINGNVVSVSGPATNFQAANVFGSGYPSFNGSIWICGSTVQGSVAVANALNQLTIGAPSSGRFEDQFNNCPGNTIGGSIDATGVKGGVEVVDNSIGGSVNIRNTVGCPNDESTCNAGTGTPNSVEVTGNNPIDGSLFCSDSKNGVDVHDNVVHGSTNCT